MISSDKQNSTQHSESKSVETVKVTKKAEVELQVDGTERLVNQYIIKEKLGSGAFSEVFKCENKYDSSQVFAMKIMSRSFLRRKKEFFKSKGSGRPGFKTALDDVEREIALMKKINHANIVKFFELIDDTSGDSIYLVMEVMPGGQVMYWNSRQRKYSTSKAKDSISLLDFERSASVFCDVTKGLFYLHSNKIVHRDLKPENILIGAKGEAKIADFGVAHKLGKEEGISTKGTPYFQAPEALSEESFNEKREIQFAVDVWALGVCLHAFLFGDLPFHDDEIPKMYERILREEINFEKEKYLKLKPMDKLSTCLKGALVKEPEKRIKIKDILRVFKVSDEQNVLTVTQAEIDAAVSVRIDFVTIIRLKLFVKRWKQKTLMKKKNIKVQPEFMSSLSQTIDSNSEASGTPAKLSFKDTEQRSCCTVQ